MKESELKVFVEGARAFFEKSTGEAAEPGVAYIKKEEEQILSEFTGVIGFSGAREGGVYVTAPAPMLAELTTIFTGLAVPEVSHIRDMVGELANHIAGFATNAFGPNFEISVPIVIEGEPRKIELPVRIPTFVIPLIWRGHRSYIVVGIAER